MEAVQLDPLFVSKSCARGDIWKHFFTWRAIKHRLCSEVSESPDMEIFKICACVMLK